MRLGETLTVASSAKRILALLNIRAFGAAGLRTSSGYKSNRIAVVVNGGVSRYLAAPAIVEHGS